MGDQTVSNSLVSQGKGKQAMTALKGSRGEYSSTLSLISALDGSRWSTPCPGRFIPGKETRYPLHRRLGGLRAGLKGSGKSRTVQPVASRCVDYAVPARDITR